MNEADKKKKGLGALDVMVLILAAAIIGSVVMRYLSNKGSDVAEGVQLDPYVITFSIQNIRDSSAENYLEKGTVFYLEDTDQVFGTLREGTSTNDAEKFYELDSGEIVRVKTEANGDLYRVDVEASVTAEGNVDDQGRFLLAGSKYVGLNREFAIYSKYVSFNIAVTGIDKAP